VRPCRICIDRATCTARPSCTRYTHTASRSRICRCVADGEIHLYLPKGSKGTLWPAVFKGHTQVHGAPLQLPRARTSSCVCVSSHTDRTRAVARAPFRRRCGSIPGRSVHAFGASERFDASAFSGGEPRFRLLRCNVQWPGPRHQNVYGGHWLQQLMRTTLSTIEFARA